MLRQAKFAGDFYPSDIFTLQDSIGNLLLKGAPRQRVKGAIVPHAGYLFAGKVYAAVYSRIEVPSKVVLLGPNHKGEGPLSSIWDKGAWETPLGKVKVDEDIADALLSYSRFLEVDRRSHEEEYSLEVQLPFLQYINPQVEIVPILLSPSDYEVYQDMADALSNVGKEWGENILFLATTDFTKYQSQEEAEQNDRLNLEIFAHLDDLLLLERMGNNQIDMCGYVPVIVNILACKALGAKRGEILSYSTSGEATGYYEEVVGYGGIVIK
ncbi:MAG: AmmeMemoRadiSam system protein B [Caldiserica bacterium]|nr:AmmeMemoRadiSam system protein B [Caldisericota bacterium]